MKSIELRLQTPNGEEIDAIPLVGFGIAEEWEESPGGTNEEIIEKVSALFDTLLLLLRERHAAPIGGRTWLKLALGEALLTADDYPEGVVIEVTVRPLEEEEDEYDAI